MACLDGVGELLDVDVRQVAGCGVLVMYGRDLEFERTHLAELSLVRLRLTVARLRLSCCAIRTPIQCSLRNTFARSASSSAVLRGWNCGPAAQTLGPRGDA